MKLNYLLILPAVILFSLTANLNTHAQIPNAGFENWTNGNPDNWQTDNNTQAAPVTQTTDSHSGTYALEGSVVSLAGLNLSPTADLFFHYTGKPASLTGYYKFTTSNNDSLSITVALFNKGVGIAAAYFSTAASVTSYTQFSANFLYGNTQVQPDSCAIAILIYPSVGAQSTTQFKIDDLGFGGATAVSTGAGESPAEFKLFNNYPNPFNPSTTVTYQLPERSMVTLRVYNVLGKEVKTLVNEEKPSGKFSVEFNASNLPSGVYYCAMQAGSYYKVSKMILIK